MGTISLCVLGLPICELVAVPARMRTTVIMTVYIRGFVSNQSQYAYGDFKVPRMHTGTVIITIHMYPGAHSFPFVTQAHLSKPITVCIRGDPVHIRAGTATSSHTGSPSTHNEILPIR